MGWRNQQKLLLPFITFYDLTKLIRKISFLQFKFITEEVILTLQTPADIIFNYKQRTEIWRELNGDWPSQNRGREDRKKN